MTTTKSVIILIATLIGASSAVFIPGLYKANAPTPPPCDPVVFVACLNTYINGFQFPINIKSVEDLRAMLQAWFAQNGQTGFIFQCRSFEAFNKCLKVQPEPCFDPDFLQATLGISRDEAFKAVTFATQYDIECTNYQSATVLDTWKCIDSTATKAMPTVTQCILSIGEALDPMPPLAQACAASQTFVTCVSAPLKASCGMAVGNLWCAIMTGVTQFLGVSGCQPPLHCYTS